ncbi:Hol1 protein [Saccharomycopsis crataegensis]|uniref:Hol1 protein n=1 Tax=Saccharomycopsis crataegensis TaxID=43959 RepID=A0AAV5QQG6_9ASCO|nr:Hol1 protein [Saccharomycopsis crataegensis]
MATSRYDDDFIPGTVNILANDSDNESKNFSEGTKLKTKNGIILMPQPSDSPNDPLNWSIWRKYSHFAVVIFITAFTAASSNDAGATQDSLNEIYGISYDKMNTGAGVLFASISVTSLVLAPTTSIWGRKISYLICTIMGLIGSIWFGYSKTTSDTIWSQLFVGASEACAEAQVQLSISDIFFQHQLGSRLTLYILATSVGTYLGPLIAGFISAVSDYSFRWVGWTAAIIYGVLIVILVFGFEETYFDRAKFLGTISNNNTAANSPKVNEYDEKKKEDNDATVNATLTTYLTNESDNGAAVIDAGLNDPPKSYWQTMQMITFASNVKGTGIAQYFKQLKMIFRVFLFPPVILSGLMWGAQDAFLTFYLTTEDDLYYDAPYNYSDAGVAIMNIPCLIGAAIGCYYAGSLSDWFVLQLAKRNNGILEAEFRLWFIFLAAIISPLGLLIFGIGTGKGWSWHSTYVGLGFIGFGWGCAGDISMSYLMDAYPEMVIEGMVGVSMINNLIGCIFTFACSPWISSIGTTKTYIVLAVLDFVIMMLCLPMIVYGKRCRAWTKDWYLEFLRLRDEI